VTNRVKQAPKRDLETAPPVVVAVTTEDDRYARSRLIAIELARHVDARLVLYDWDAANEDSREAAGRDAIAGQVADARKRGVEAAAWHPSEPGADALAAFAAEHGATTVVLPEDLAAKGRLERPREGAMDPVATIRGRSRVRIVVVPRPLAG
jgi:hypothetical protein